MKKQVCQAWCNVIAPYVPAGTCVPQLIPPSHSDPVERRVDRAQRRRRRVQVVEVTEARQHSGGAAGAPCRTDEPGGPGQHLSAAGTTAQKALTPVRARPMSSFCTWLVPS